VTCAIAAYQATTKLRGALGRAGDKRRENDGELYNSGQTHARVYTQWTKTVTHFYF